MKSQKEYSQEIAMVVDQVYEETTFIIGLTTMHGNPKNYVLLPADYATRIEVILDNGDVVSRDLYDQETYNLLEKGDHLIVIVKNNKEILLLDEYFNETGDLLLGEAS